MNMHWQCAILLVVVGLAWVVDCNNGNWTEERRLTKEKTSKIFKDLQYPDFFVIGSMKCATTSLSKVS